MHAQPSQNHEQIAAIANIRSRQSLTLIGGWFTTSAREQNQTKSFNRTALFANQG